MTDDSLKTHKDEATRVTLIGSALDLALGILKIGAGLLAGSFALVSDGIHSLSDLVTDGFVLLMARLAHEGPDREHPYGHRRFETLGTIIIGVGLFIVAGLICYDSLRRMIAGEAVAVPGLAALAVAALSIVGKEWIYRYTKRVAERLESSLLLANAWHSRTDALSSIAVLAGILGALLGYPWMDLAAAVLVGLMVGHIAWRLLAGSLSELVDTAPPPEQVAEIREHARGLTGIVGVHGLRSRRHGGRIFLDLHVQVNSKISVSEGHYLGDRLSQSLRRRFPAIADIVVHIDPELDAEGTAPEPLPLRQEAIPLLFRCWEGLLEPTDVESFSLHYLKDQVQVDVYLTNSNKSKEILDKVKDKSRIMPWLGNLRFYVPS